MNTLGKWGAYLFVPQALVAITLYCVSEYRDAGIGLALFSAGVLAIVFCVFAMLCGKTVGVALSISSLSAIVAVFCLMGSSGIFASIFGFISLSTAAIAAMLVDDRKEGSTLHFFLSALPVVGALRYLNDVFDKKVDSMMKR